MNDNGVREEDNGNGDAAPMGVGAMLPQKDSLPRPQIAIAFLDGDGQRCQGQNRSNVGRHVVRTFAVVGKRPIAVGNQTSRELLQVDAHARVRVFADDERRAGMMHEHEAQALDDLRSHNNLVELASELVGSASARFYCQMLPIHRVYLMLCGLNRT